MEMADGRIVSSRATEVNSIFLLSQTGGEGSLRQGLYRASSGLSRLTRVLTAPRQVWRASPGLAHSFFNHFQKQSFRAKKRTQIKKLRMRVLYHKPVEHEKATKRPTLLHKKMTLLWQNEKNGEKSYLCLTRVSAEN